MVSSKGQETDPELKKEVTEGKKELCANVDQAAYFLE